MGEDKRIGGERMKTTILEIINKMAKGEDIPAKIKIDDNILTWDSMMYDYRDEDGDWLFDDYAINESLNDEVEILETTVTINNHGVTFADGGITFSHFFGEPVFNKKIEKLVKSGMTKNQKKIADKINEIIDHLNEE